MPETDWQPSATLQTLSKRADLLQQIRSFFSAAGAMEVDTPLLSAFGVTDLHIDCIETAVCEETRYLQSSPEYFMKRLLAAGAGPIYSLGKVFRDGERGPRHAPEFTLLEWYRPGWDEYQLMSEVEALARAIACDQWSTARIAYGELFQQVIGLDPHNCSLAQLSREASERCGGDWQGESRATLLDLLFSTQVEPAMPGGLVSVYHYPSCMSALAALGRDDRGNTVARRFEVFINGMELGNGYFELTDATEQQSRFEADIALRAAAGRKPMAADTRLIDALRSGMPSCAGIALGVDRLLMQILGETDIRRVLPFSD